MITAIDSQSQNLLSLRYNIYIKSDGQINKSTAATIDTTSHGLKQTMDCLELDKISRTGINVNYFEPLTKSDPNIAYNNLKSMQMGIGIYLAAREYKEALDEIMNKYDATEHEMRINSLNEIYSSYTKKMADEYVQHFSDYCNSRVNNALSTSKAKNDFLEEISNLQKQLNSDIVTMFANAKSYVQKNGDITTAGNDIITGNSQTFTYADLLAFDSGFIDKFNLFLSKTVNHVNINEVKQLVYGLSDYAGNLFHKLIKCEKLVIIENTGPCYDYLFTGTSIEEPDDVLYASKPKKLAQLHMTRYGEVSITNNMATLAKQYNNALNEIISNCPAYERDEHIKALDESFEGAVNTMASEFVSKFLSSAKNYRYAYIEDEKLIIHLNRAKSMRDTKNYLTDTKNVAIETLNNSSRNIETLTLTDINMNYTNKEMEEKFFNDIKGMFYNARDYMLKNDDLETALHDTITGNSKTFTYSDLLILDDGLKKEIFGFITNNDNWNMEDKMQNIINKSGLSNFTKDFFYNMVEETSQTYKKDNELIKERREYYKQRGLEIDDSVESTFSVKLKELYDPSKVVKVDRKGTPLAGKAIDIYA